MKVEEKKTELTWPLMSPVLILPIKAWWLSTSVTETWFTAHLLIYKLNCFPGINESCASFNQSHPDMQADAGSSWAITQIPPWTKICYYVFKYFPKYYNINYHAKLDIFKKGKQNFLSRVKLLELVSALTWRQLKTLNLLFTFEWKLVSCKIHVAARL